MKAKRLLPSFFIISLTLTALFLVSCASQQIEQQRKQRNKFAEETGFYCEFINGESVPAIDLDLNLKMAKKCDKNRNFTVNSYTQPNEQRGLIFCCILAKEDFKEDGFKPENPKAKASPEKPLDTLIKVENNATNPPVQGQKPKGN